MKTLQVIGAVLALTVSSTAFAQDATTTQAVATPMAMEKMSAADYVATAASSDMFEIESSKMALEMSKSDGVQTFAKHMVSDHSTTTKEIMAAAEKDGIAVPKAMMPKHAAMLEKLKAAKGDDFTAQYIQMQVMAHEEAVALHTGYSQNGDDAALKAVATKAVPIVTEHLKDAQALASKA